MSELDPETLAKVSEQYEGILIAIRNQAGMHVALDVTARVIATHLAGALVCIEMQQEQIRHLRERIECLEDEADGLTEGDGDV